MSPETRSQKRVRLESILSQLPLDLWPLIFQHVIDSGGGIFAAMKLSHVCSTWRNIALRTPGLWTDVRLRGLVKSSTKAEHAQALLEACAQRSNKGITHADLQGFDDVDTFLACLDIISESALTLVSLEVLNNNICFCVARRHWAGPYTEAWARKRNEIGRAAVQEAAEKILDVLARAPQLTVLTLEISFEGVDAPQTTYVARPATVTLIKPTKCCRWHTGHDDEYASHFRTIRGLLEQLTSNVEHFSLHHRRWQSHHFPPVCVAMHRQRLSLKSLQMPLWPTLFQDAFVQLPATFPVLENLILSDHDTSHWWKPYMQPSPATAALSIHAPALCRMSGPVSMLDGVVCPSVTCVHAWLRESEDIEALAERLSSWPELVNLTVGLCTNLYDHWGASAVVRILEALKPSPSSSPCTPKLRALGIRGKPLAFDFNPVVDPQWPSTPWTEAENEYWRKDLFHEMVCHGARTEVGAELPALEAARRAHAQCLPLDIIKLWGVYIKPTVWETLQRTSRAEVRCQPDHAEKKHFHPVAISRPREEEEE